MREPLVHFLLGGALLFALFEWSGAPDEERRSRIVVDEARVAMLARGFQRTWGRAPSPAELEGLIDDFLTEELLYREALALDLDRDDLVVRRRMRQKMEFLNEGLEERAPTDDELRGFLEANAERFRIPPRVSFAQVFVDPEAGQERAADLLAQLRAGANPDALGDPTLLPAGLVRATPSEVAATFGPPLAEALAQVPRGAWSGPLASGFGLHLVRVSDREPARLPALEEARVAVELAWAAARREEARERFYAALRARYDIEVRRPGGLDVAAGP